LIKVIVSANANARIHFFFPRPGLKVQQQISYQIGNNLYLSITDRCTLECAFCPKTFGDMSVKGYDLTFDHRPTAEEVIASIDDPARYDEVVFCGYGEPTLRLNLLLEVAKYVKQQGGRVRVNTDGLCNLIHKQDTLPQFAECVDALSVSLNAQNSEIYDVHCRPNLPGSYEAMLEFLRRAPEYIADVTATAIDGLEGVDIAACETIAKSMNVKFRRRTLNEVG
jgi:TatD family-associated radical SAM protein